APLTARPQWRGKNGRAATTAADLTAHVCDRWQAGVAILNCLYGVGLLFSEDMAFAFTRALNDWVAKEWLDRDPRPRASSVVPLQNTEYGVDEIGGCAKDRRFVQILVLACRKRRSAAGISGRFMRRPSATACRLAFMPARPTAIPSPRWDGRATTSRTTPAIPKPFSRKWRAWSAKACSPNIPASKWCCSNPG